MKNPVVRLTGFVDSNRILLCALLTPALLMAQASTGSLSGTVTDPNGALVPSALVTAKSTTMGTSVATTTSEAGLFVFPRLPVGVYDITAQLTGFKTSDHSGIEIRVASRQELEIRLEVG